MAVRLITNSLTKDVVQWSWTMKNFFLPLLKPWGLTTVFKLEHVWQSSYLQVIPLHIRFSVVSAVNGSEAGINPCTQEGGDSPSLSDRLSAGTDWTLVYAFVWQRWLWLSWQRSIYRLGRELLLQRSTSVQVRSSFQLLPQNQLSRQVFCQAPQLGHQISTMWPC